MERYVEDKKLQMRASDMAWAWVAQKAHDGEAAGEVFRPELGPLDTPQVLWQLVAMASTGWNVDVREQTTRETLQRVVLSRQVLQNIYRATDKDRARQNGVSVEEVKAMDLEAVMMTPRLAAMVCQNVNKLKGLRGKGVGPQGRGQCGVPGLAGGDTDSQRGDGGAPPSESAKGDAGTGGGGGAHCGDSGGGGGGWSHIGEEGPGGGNAAEEGKVGREEEDGKVAASGWGSK